MRARNFILSRTLGAGWARIQGRLFTKISWSHQDEKVDKIGYRSYTCLSYTPNHVMQIVSTETGKQSLMC